MNEASNEDEDYQDEWVIFSPKKSENIDMDYVTHLTFNPSVKVVPKFEFKEHEFLQWCANHGKLAFYNCSELEHVKLPDTVVSISLGAFQWCEALTRVQLPSGLKVLKRSTFRGCKALIEIDLPLGLSKIETNTFYGCESLRNVKIPDTVKVIGKRAFGYCRSLTVAELPKGLKKIRSGTFAGCRLLSGIVLPSSLEKIGYQAFMSCTGLLGVEFAKDISHRIQIDQFAFARCSNLVNVCIPETVVSVTSLFARFKSCVSTPAAVAGVEPFSRNYQLRDRNGHEHLRRRYAQLPIHNLCYHSSVTTVDELTQALDVCDDWESPTDSLNMTPFHIVATAANPRVELLECLLAKYPVEMLTQKDTRGFAMVDYLLKNTRGLQMLQLVLRHVFSEWLRQEGEDPSMELDLNGQIESLAECTNGRSRNIVCSREIFESVGFHMQNELTTLLELASWKRRMMELETEISWSSKDKDNMNRESCRYQCGAEVVIQNVTECLWTKDDSKYHTALSAFPLFTLEKNMIGIIEHTSC